MFSFLKTLNAPLLCAAALLAAGTAACAGSAATVSPSALSSNPSNYDGQSVSVSGTAKDPKTRKTRRGTLLAYQLCDTACVNVVQFGTSTVADGATVTVVGMFHATFGRVQQMTNVVVVGGGHGHWGGGTPQASPSP